MRTYLLDPEKLKKTKKSIYLLYGISALVMVAIIIWLSWEKIMAKDLLSILVIPLMLGLFLYSAVRAIRQREAFWKFYELSIDQDTLTQKQPNFPELHIGKDEVISLKEEKFGLVVSTEKYSNLLGITRNLREEDYQEVKELLNTWVNANKSQSLESD